MPEPLLNPSQLLKDKPHSVLGAFFKNKLGVVQRARWRWVFPEPADGVAYPRGRARSKILDSVSSWDMANELSTEQSDKILPPHNRTNTTFKVGPKAAAEWSANCLLTTNIDYNHVPAAPMESPTSFNSLTVWLKMINLAHSEALLKPGAMAVLEAWSKRSTERQRSALSNIFLLLSDFLATGGSSLLSETKIKYMPKAIQHREAYGPLESSLGRPSTAPIVSANFIKVEQKLKAIDEAATRRAQELMITRAQQGPPPRAPRSSHPAYGSTIPMKWPMKAPDLTTSTQAMMRSVKPSDARHVESPSFSGNPPASAFNRCIGGPTWHGYAHYPRLTAVAAASFPELRPLTSY